MMPSVKWLLVICWALSEACSGTPLHPSSSGSPGSSLGKRGGHLGKSRQPRQVAFLPFIALPPIYHVHQVVLVQPDDRCGVGRPLIPAVGPEGDLENRFGGGDDRRNGTSTSGVKEPSRCVWSIVACCAPGSRNIRYTCFELLGCPGAFWDTNPCDEKVVMAAANTALRFYERNSTDSRRR